MRVPSDKVWMSLIGEHLNRVDLLILGEVFLKGFISPSKFGSRENEHRSAIYGGCKRLLEIDVLKRASYKTPEGYEDLTSQQQSYWRIDRGIPRNFKNIVLYAFDYDGINKIIDVQASKLKEMKVAFNRDKNGGPKPESITLAGILLGGLIESKVFPKRDHKEIIDRLVSHIGANFYMFESRPTRESNKSV